MSVADYIVPLVILCILFAALCKKLPAFDLFCKGAAGGFPLVLSILPYVIGIMVMVQLLRVSGLTDLVATAMSPVFRFLGIPQELAELVVLRPFSGSGTLALYRELVTVYGADAYATRCAAVIMSCSETIFYITGVYLASTKTRRLRYGIPVALLATFLGIIVSCLLCRIL